MLLPLGSFSAEVMFLGSSGDIVCDGEHDRKENEMGRMGDGVFSFSFLFFGLLFSPLFKTFLQRCVIESLRQAG